MDAVSKKKAFTWNSQVAMKPIEEIAKELETAGWHIFWESEVEAIAIRDKSPEGVDADIVELMQNLGIKLKKAGKEYAALCPFHDDHNPSLSVNKERNVWHCFGCGRGGDAREFLNKWQAHSKKRRMIGSK